MFGLELRVRDREIDGHNTLVAEYWRTIAGTLRLHAINGWVPEELTEKRVALGHRLAEEEKSIYNDPVTPRQQLDYLLSALRPENIKGRLMYYAADFTRL